MKQARAAIIVTACIAAMSCASAAYPLAYRLYDQNAAAMGSASAVTASIKGPASIYYNPAALAAYPTDKQNNISAGFNYLMPHFEYENNAGVSEDADSKNYISPQLYYAFNPADKPYAFGFGLFSSFGLGTHWEDTGSLRYANTSSELTTIDANPSFSYKVSDELSVGAGLDYVSADAVLEKKVDYGLLLGAPGAYDVQSKLEGDGDGYGYNVGFLYKISEQDRVGFLYRSHVNLDIEGTTKLLGVPTPAGPATIRSDASTTLELPAYIRTGYAHDFTQKLTIEADIDWTQWDTVDTLTVHNDNPMIGDVSSAKNYNNAFLYAVGASYAYSETVDLRCGYVYVETPVEEKYFEPMVPDSNRHAFHLGASYHIGDFSLDAGYQLLLFEERSINNSLGEPYSTVDGDYSSYANNVSLAVNYGF